MTSRKRKRRDSASRLRALIALLLLAVSCLLLAIVPGKESSEPVAPAVVAVAGAPDAAIDFSRDILPVLGGKCFACHGPDTTQLKGKLRLDVRETAIKKGAVVPGKPEESELIRRIESTDPDERMPPAKSNKTLTAAEKVLLRRWIEQGAPYQLHWAFRKLQRPAIPAVAQRDWVKNDVDAFVLARLEKAGIMPSPLAERATLIRRLSLDLRGLPPTLAEVDAYVADNSADAYEKLVDRMLASPHYGEKMAQLWLDLARFGDTSGYNQDSTRQMWLWRDGVIEAFNRNQPFDQFTIEQLAGDLLPNATVAQKIASGFNRHTRFNEEDGADPEEWYARSDADRANTLGQVWLGLTLGCVECHDHKYDPISHKEYYQLVAYFRGIAEPKAGFLHDQPLPPILELPTAEQKAALSKDRAEIAEIEKDIAEELRRVRYSDPFDGALVSAGQRPEEYRRSMLAWELKVEGDVKLPIDVRIALSVDRGTRGEAQKKTLRDYYLRKVYLGTRDVFGELERDLATLAQRIKRIEAAVPHAMISEELANPRPAFVLIRGDFQQKGERVHRAVPAVLPPLPNGVPNNRLGLARWLVSRDHPLTARVAVNRLWAQMFGTGIVRTLGDFGSQGDYPSHPELLDWLATEFVRTGWNVKVLFKTIALSSAYRQSSAYRMEKGDPDNRLLYRAPRYRLSAEEVRDNALAIAGLLSDRVGGPSAMPYQPDGYYVGKYEGWLWQASTGDEQYRRGLYTFWRRSALHPMFAIFDAPTREECAVARPRTNTPLQALVTLNDPTFVEAARVFAQRVLVDGPDDLDGRLVFAFRTALARRPEPAELEVLRARYRQQLKHYQGDRDAALKLVSSGQAPRSATLDVAEHAAWTAVAGMVLNLDETIMRE
jgi:hypothetical protein